MMKHMLFLALIFAAFNSAVDHAQDGIWQAGLALRVITPIEPMWLGGYAARKEPSQGKLHDLYAKAVAFEDNSGERAVLLQHGRELAEFSDLLSELAMPVDECTTGFPPR